MGNLEIRKTDSTCIEKIRKDKGLTGEEMLDTLVMIAEKLEDNLHEHITKLKYVDGYLSSFMRSLVPWATYNCRSGEKHNPFFGTNYAKVVKKRDIAHLEGIVQFDDSDYYDKLSADDTVNVVPIILYTSLDESQGYFEKDHLPELIKYATYGTMPNFMAAQFARLFESALRMRGYKDIDKEHDQFVQLLLKNKVKLPQGVSLHGNASAMDEDLFVYKNRYFLMSACELHNTSSDYKKQKIQKYPSFERYYYSCITLFFGGIIYPEKGTNPIAHLIAKPTKQNMLPFLAPPPLIE